MEDIKRIVKSEDCYTVMYLGEFCTYIFNYCEQLIIKYFGKPEANELDNYYKKEEKLLKSILNIF